MTVPAALAAIGLFVAMPPWHAGGKIPVWPKNGDVALATVLDRVPRSAQACGWASRRLHLSGRPQIVDACLLPGHVYVCLHSAVAPSGTKNCDDVVRTLIDAGYLPGPH